MYSDDEGDAGDEDDDDSYEKAFDEALKNLGRNETGRWRLILRNADAGEEFATDGPRPWTLYGEPGTRRRWWWHESMDITSCSSRSNKSQYLLTNQQIGG